MVRGVEFKFASETFAKGPRSVSTLLFLGLWLRQPQRVSRIEI